MREIINNMIACVCGALFVFIFMLLMMTPEKDKYGNYTNFRKYWTSDKYLCENFDVSENYCIKK
jgi:hypothetical protein